MEPLGRKNYFIEYEKNRNWHWMWSTHFKNIKILLLPNYDFQN